MARMTKDLTRSFLTVFVAVCILSSSLMVSSVQAQPAFTPTPTATVSCPNLRVLIVHADNPARYTLRSQILAETGVSTVDFFNAGDNGGSSTPSLAQLRQYDMVVAYSNYQWLDDVTLGNNFADFVDAGGVVVESVFAWYASGFDIRGRWLNDNYSPFVHSSSISSLSTSLGTYNASNPLMMGVSVLSGTYYKIEASLSAGALQVAAWNNDWPLVVYKGRVVAINAFLGDYSGTPWSGQFGKVIVNAGHWLAYCGPTPTPTILLSTLDKAVLAPVPATRGQRVCMFYTKAPASSEMEIYNANGEKLGRISVVDLNNHCWDTKNAAPGVYFVKIVVKYQDGKSETIWRKAVVIP